MLTRLSPAFPFSLLNLAYGLSDVSLRDYNLGLIAILPGTVLFCALGALAGDAARFGEVLAGETSPGAWVFGLSVCSQQWQLCGLRAVQPARPWPTKKQTSNPWKRGEHQGWEETSPAGMRSTQTSPSGAWLEAQDGQRDRLFGTTAVGFDPSMKEWVGHNDCELSVYWKIWVGMMLILILTSSTPYPILLRSVIFF